MNDWIPVVGQKLVFKKSFNDHGKEGVVVVVKEYKPSMRFLTVSSCTCGEFGHMNEAKWSWPWVRDCGYLEPYLEITDAEAKKAIPLPSPEDVASFFKVKP